MVEVTGLGGMGTAVVHETSTCKMQPLGSGSHFQKLSFTEKDVFSMFFKSGSSFKKMFLGTSKSLEKWQAELAIVVTGYG